MLITVRSDLLQIVDRVPSLVSSLQLQNTDASRCLLGHLVELVDCLMFQYPGFPDIYELANDALKVSKPGVW